MANPKPRKPWPPAAVVLLMGAVVALPATLTLLQVKHPGRLQMISDDPTPYGYTWSLSLFLVPILALGIWFSRRQGMLLARRAFWRTLPILTLLGFGLDFFFGSWFLCFPNRGATLGWDIPVVGGTVPVEEFVFYIAGFVVVLLTYLWCDEAWLSLYNDTDYEAGLDRAGRLVRFHAPSLVMGLALAVAAIVVKKAVLQEPGFPSYFLFLLAVSIVPSMGFFRAVEPYVNWRGFSLTFFFLLLISLLWEASLAVPYGWRGYQREAMIGIDIGAWANLPIEAVLVWIAVTYTSVIFYEVIKIWLASGERAKKAFLG